MIGKLYFKHTSAHYAGSALYVSAYHYKQLVSYCVAHI